MEHHAPQRTPLLEICVDTLAAGQAAARGGADRIELCAELISGGVTPSPGVLEELLATVTIPVHCMVRPRGGDFCYSAGELRAMERDIAAMRRAGAAGVVFGVLTPEGSVDTETTRRLVSAARPMRVTFHRAFDVALALGGEPEALLECVLEAGADILLTSGGAPRVTEVLPVVARLVHHAASRIEVMAGSGIRIDNATAVLTATGVLALHASLRRQHAHAGHVLPDALPSFTLDEADVRTMAETLHRRDTPATRDV